MTRPISDRLHGLIARSDFGVWAAAKLRNQTQAIIGKRMSDGADSQLNGEAFLLDVIGGQVRTAVDVGANVGTWFAALQARTPSLERALLVEPGEEAARRLRTRFGSDAAVTIVEAAVSDYVGVGKFFEGADASELSSMMPLAMEKPGERTIAVTTLDEVVREYFMEFIDFLKIDAEGMDGKVISGARSIMSRRAVKYIQFEYNNSWINSGETLLSVIERMRSYDYYTFCLKADGLHRVDYDLVGEYFRYSNFVGVSEPYLPCLRGIIRD